MFKVLCDGKHLHYVKKMDQNSIAHIYETRSNVGNCFITPLYMKSKCQTSFIYRCIHLWNNIPNDLKQMPNDPDI